MYIIGFFWGHLYLLKILHASRAKSVRFSFNSKYQTLTTLSADKFIAKMIFSPQILSLDIVRLREQYIAKTLSPLEVIRHIYQKIASYHEKAVWIHLIPEADSIIRAQ
jgi:hypothetical protein